MKRGALSKEQLELFIQEVCRSYQFFCLYKYLYNERLFKINEIRNKDNKLRYRNFWGIILILSQQKFCLSIRTLTDREKYYNKKKQKNDYNLSIEYVCSKIEIDNYVLAKKIRKELRKHRRFIDSVNHLVDKKIAHKDKLLVRRKMQIQVGREEFYYWLSNIIEEIRISRKRFSKCQKIDLEYWEKFTKEGVEAVLNDIFRVNSNQFEEIIKYNP